MYRMATTSLPQPGHLVRVRQRESLVEDITLSPSPGEVTVVSLSWSARPKPCGVVMEFLTEARIVF